MEDRLRMLADPAYWVWVRQVIGNLNRRLGFGNYNAGPMQVLPIIRERLVEGEPQGSLDVALWGLAGVDQGQQGLRVNAKGIEATWAP